MGMTVERAFDVLRTYCDHHKTDDPGSEEGIVASAINEIMPKLEKLLQIQVIEYKQHIGPYEIDQTAVFDKRKISEAEVRECILHGEEYNPDVAFMSNPQFQSIFH